MTFEGLLKQEICTITEFNDNIYPLYVEESVKAPYVCYTQSGGERDKDLSGFTGQKEAIYEVNILANKYSKLKDLENKVIDKIIGLVGKAADGREIQDIDISDPYELYEDAIKLHRSNIEFTVFY